MAYNFGIRILNCRSIVPLAESTSLYGETFEAFVITQCFFLASYYHRDYKFSYLKTKDDAEIDLVVERPGKPILFIEIKITDNVQNIHLSHLKMFAKDFGLCETVCFSRDPYAKKMDDVIVYPWAEGIKRFFVCEK